MTANILITLALAAAVAMLVAAITQVPDGAAERYAHGRRYHRDGRARHTARWLDAHDVPEDARHSDPAPVGQMLAEIATPKASPFAPKVRAA